MSATNSHGKGSIVTPEAVLLDFELAGVGARSLAYGIDLLIQGIALFVMVMAVSFLAFGSELVALIVGLVLLIVIVLGYPTLMETFNNGRTVGRMVVNTRVVTVEGAPIRFRQAFVRALLGILELLATAGGLAVVVAMVTRRGQRLGDLVAGTMVLREPTAGLSQAVSFYPPSYLASWSQTVDTRTLGNDAYQMVRDLITRQDLTPEARSAVADELAVLVSERLPHAAKTPAVPSMDYLTAIATATQSQSPGSIPPPPAPSTRIGSNAPRTSPQPPVPTAPWPSSPSSVHPPTPAASPPVAPTYPAPPAGPTGYPTPPVAPAVTPAPPEGTPDPPRPTSTPAEAPNDGGFAAPG